MLDCHTLGFALRRACLAAGVLLMFAAYAAAQAAAATPWTELAVQSSAIGTRTIRIATPGEYARGTDRYAVLVMLDAEAGPMLRLAIAQASYLSANGDGVPAMTQKRNILMLRARCISPKRCRRLRWNARRASPRTR
jgi:hypothetical protein